MRLALFVSILSSILALNAETIQGKVVRVADGDTITILDGVSAKKMVFCQDANQIASWDFRKQKKESEVENGNVI